MQSKEQTQQIFRDLNQLWDLVRHQHTPNVAQGERRVLHCIAQWGGQAQPHALSKALSVSTARIAAILSSLERKQEIVRLPNPQDKRCVQVEITVEGRAHLQQIYKQMGRQMQAVLDALGPQDAQAFARIVHRLPSILSNLEEKKGEN